MNVQEAVGEYDELLGVDPPDEIRPREHPALVRLHAALIAGDRIKLLPKPESLVEGVLDADTLAVLYGRAGVGKSFVALDLALSVATGTRWQGHEVRRGRVLYVVAEGASGTGARLDAWQKYQLCIPPARSCGSPPPPNFQQKNEIDALR